MTTTSSAAPSADDKDLVVSVRGLKTAFGKGAEEVVIHKDLDMSIARGEVVSLVGGSGTGKTVLLRQILGLERPAAGEVTVLGQPAAQLGRAGAASRVGMLFQQGALFSAFSVLENIAFPLRELKTLPDALVRDTALVKLQMVGLGPEQANKMPADLSGGMIKRVALARALVMDPPLLLLDEPTAGLDPRGSDEFVELLRSMHRELDLTVVMVTHDLDTLFALSTRVVVLAEKHVIVSGKPSEVVAFEHPFIKTFFLGDRGQRAMTPIEEAAPDPDALNPDNVESAESAESADNADNADNADAPAQEPAKES